MDQVWANWEKIKRAEKEGSIRERKSALDGIPRRMPSLMRAQKLVKKATKAGLAGKPKAAKAAKGGKASRAALGRQLFEIAQTCQDQGWSAEELLRSEIRRREKDWRKAEAHG